ncbi:MAG: zinc ribbon domain-containing protein [Candidatus Heimdallarchaeota archaeon]|nr:zinc ribbon domain-containing protein [Candidatus Heimdallarchaeota archaeon]
MYDIYELIPHSNTIEITVDMDTADFDIVLLSTNNYYAAMIAIYNTDQVSPHFIGRSESVGRLSESLSVQTSLDKVYLIIYCLDELSGISGITHDYDLQVSTQYTQSLFVFTLDFRYSGYIYENGDTQLTLDELAIYQFIIPERTILDITIKMTRNEESVLWGILGEFNDEEDMINYIEEASTMGGDLPDGIYGLDSFGYDSYGSSFVVHFSYHATEETILNLGLISLDTENPDSMHYTIYSSIEENEDRVHVGSYNYTAIGIGIVIILILSFILLKDSFNRKRRIMNTLISKPNIQQPVRQQFSPPQTIFSAQPMDKSVDINFCERCGAKLKDVKNFCHRCGAKIY